MSNDKVYVHELVEITGQQRARYMHHMTAYWCPESRKQRDQLCFGVWGTLGSTGRWPEVVNLWEYAGWEALAQTFELEVSNPVMQDPVLQEWWRVAAPLRRGGLDRILVPAPWTRSIDQLVAEGVRGESYAHELVTIPPGRAPALLDLVAEVGRPCVEPMGLELIGAFRVAMSTDTECILIWTIPDWTTWAAFERAWLAHGPLTKWRTALETADASLRRTLMIDSPLNPMHTGRQPMPEDRLPLEDFFPPLPQ